MIRLRNVRYSEFENTPQEWKLENLSLGQANLIVGKNASGKSRSLNIIHALSRYLAGIRNPSLSGNFDVEFVNDEQQINYQIKFDNEQVVEEKFSIDGKILLNRGNNGEGKIWAHEIGKEISFQTPINRLAAFTRRDTIQHGFLEPLYVWGSSLRHYAFGTTLGKDLFAIPGNKVKTKPDERNPNEVVGLYLQAKREFEEQFNLVLIKDFQKLNYDILEVGVKPLVSIRLESELPGDLVGLFLQEKALPGITDQNSMSQGMFRALSLLIQINYSQMSGKSTCILIDDIGEGLDFDRSCHLIDLLREKAKASDIQLVMTTNDRFVMNRVPLEEWSVIQRQGNQVRVLNYENSRELFEEFKFTGLSNFSFLEMDFASGIPEEEIEVHG